MMFAASRAAMSLPSFATASLPEPFKRPSPSKTVILFFFIRKPTPLESLFATLRERFTTAAAS